MFGIKKLKKEIEQDKRELEIIIKGYENSLSRVNLENIELKQKLDETKEALDWYIEDGEKLYDELIKIKQYQKGKHKHEIKKD